MVKTITQSITILAIVTLITSYQLSAQIACWYDYDKYAYLVSNEVVLPAINSNMPLEVMATYIVADTLCKTVEWHALDSAANALSADSIAIAFQSRVHAQDYDPMLHNQMLNYTSLADSLNYNESYRSLCELIDQEYYENVRPKNYYDSLRDSYSGGIYYVKVKFLEERIDSTDVWPMDVGYEDEYMAELGVVGKIFGIRSPEMCFDDILEKSDECITAC
jgi:hypothetical protein